MKLEAIRSKLKAFTLDILKQLEEVRKNDSRIVRTLCKQVYEDQLTVKLENITEVDVIASQTNYSLFDEEGSVLITERSLSLVKQLLGEIDYTSPIL